MASRARAVRLKEVEIDFDWLPRSAVHRTDLAICLKCAFHFFTRQLKLTLRTAYSELKKHVPGESDFTGAATARPHFFEREGVGHCPYCAGSRRWFATFHAIRLDADPSIEKERKRIWNALKKDPDRYELWTSERTPMEIFSEWLDRLRRGLDLEDDGRLMKVASEQIKRGHPSTEWDKIPADSIEHIRISDGVEAGWSLEGNTLYVSRATYGDVLLIQHLISRSHLRGGNTFEGRLTLRELVSALNGIGYFQAKGIDVKEAEQPYKALENAVQALVTSGPTAVYYAVDRSDYLNQLKSVYEKKREK